MTAKMFHAPDQLPFQHRDNPWIFLAGTIDNGDSDNWQLELFEKFKHFNVTFINPRRENWDKNTDEAEIKRQINWEIVALQAADIVLVYFAPGSKSPVSMLELGLYLRTPKLIACCPPGFWRHLNVKLACEFYHRPCYDSLEIATADAIMKGVEAFQNREIFQRQ